MQLVKASADWGSSSAWDASGEKAAALSEAAFDVSHVEGLTHNFYRYPARFSPTLARAVIETFTEPGDIVLDPFVGGGTSLVEALALGRRAVGVDISSLATFVTRVKTALYSERELEVINRWIDQVPDCINMHACSTRFEKHAAAGYYKNLTSRHLWRLRKAIEQALSSATALRPRAVQDFARCVILRSAQWGLDSRKKLPTIPQFRAAVVSFAREMVQGARELHHHAAVNGGLQSGIVCLNRSAIGIEADPLLRSLAKAPKLVLMSPPYPGIHVLYHRWQIGGRKESPAPFWIANQLDGSGSSYYTMGDRQSPGLKAYFDQIGAAISSVAAISDHSTTVVQVVAFSDATWQLSRYLQANEEAGFRELKLSTPSPDGRLWRTVPNRKWYSDQRGTTPASREVILFYRKA